MKTAVDHAMERLARARPFSAKDSEELLSTSEESNLLARIMSDDVEVVSISPRALHHRRTTIVVIASVAAMAVALVVYVSVPSPAVRAKSGVTSTGTWRLAGYFQPNWKQSLSAPHAGALTCPTTTVCYLTASVPVSNPIGHGPNPATLLYVSTDHGATWKEVESSGATSFGALVCPETNASDCLAAGLQGTTPVLLVTTDGGTTWVGRALPTGAGQLIQLVCTSLSHCVGTMSASTDPYSSDGVAYVTDDGGKLWTPADTGGLLLEGFNCTGTTCVGTGYTAGSTPDSAATIVNLYSHDAGSTWNEAAVPVGENFEFLDPSPDTLACPDATHCFGLGGIGAPGRPGEQAVVESSDGGASWQFVPPLTGIQAFGFALACPSDQDCFIVGGGRQSDVTGNSIAITGPGKPVDGMITVPTEYSPWVYSTTDGGSTWSKTTLAVPKQVPVGTELTSLDDIGQISCPSVTTCVGVGTGEEVGQHTATYTNASLR